MSQRLRNIYFHRSEVIVWKDAAAAFMPLSFMVNGSVVNLETQCLPGKMCHPSISWAGCPILRSGKHRVLKKTKKQLSTQTVTVKQSKKKKIQLEFPNALLPCLHIKERVRDTDRGRKRTKTIRKNRNESNWGITERSSRAN